MIVALPTLWLSALPVGATEAQPSLDDLERGSSVAASLVEACMTRPPTCRAEDDLAQLGRAFYTIALDRWVHGEPVSEPELANIKHLTPELFESLPAALRRSNGIPSGWVVALGQEPIDAPLATPAVYRPAPVGDADTLPVPGRRPSEVEAAMASYVRGDPAQAVRRLFPLARGGDLEAQLVLARTLEELGLPMSAMLVLGDVLANASRARLQESLTVTPHLARLSRQLSTNRTLLELVPRIQPEGWDVSVRGEAWLAAGSVHQERGALSTALRAYQAVPANAPSYREARYRAGLIHAQVGNHHEAINALRSSWDAPYEGGPHDERLRDMAIWHIANLYEELGRPADARSYYELVTFTDSPLAGRAAVRSAWSAHLSGDIPEALRLLADAPRDRYVDEALLRARMALIQGRDRQALLHIDGALSRSEPLQRTIEALLEATPTLWADVLSGRYATLPAPVREVIDADPALVRLRVEHAAIQADLARIAEQDASWRADVGELLAVRLGEALDAVALLGTATLYQVLSEEGRHLERSERGARKLRLDLTR